MVPRGAVRSARSTDFSASGTGVFEPVMRGLRERAPGLALDLIAEPWATVPGTARLAAKQICGLVGPQKAS